MLRTTNKKVIERLREHILDNFQPENYDPESSNTPEQNLVSQIDYMQYGDRGIYQTALDYVQGGSLLVYYREQRDFLGEILEENEFEREHKYSDNQVFKTYCHLVAREMAKIYYKVKQEK